MITNNISRANFGEMAAGLDEDCAPDQWLNVAVLSSSIDGYSTILVFVVAYRIFYLAFSG